MEIKLSSERTQWNERVKQEPVGPISEFVIEEFQSFSQNSQGDAISGEWREFHVECGNLVCCFGAAENGWSAWIVEKRSPIKRCYGKPLPGSATVLVGTWTGLVVTAKAIIP